MQNLPPENNTINNNSNNASYTQNTVPQSLFGISSPLVNLNVNQNTSLVNNLNITPNVPGIIKTQEIPNFSVGHQLTVTDNTFSQIHDAALPYHQHTTLPQTMVPSSMPPSQVSSTIGQKRRQSFDNSQTMNSGRPPSYPQSYIPIPIPNPVTQTIHQGSFVSTPLQTSTSAVPPPLEQANSLSLSRDFHHFVLNVHGIKNPSDSPVPGLPHLSSSSPPTSPTIHNNQNVTVTATPIELNDLSMASFSLSPNSQLRMASLQTNLPKEFLCAWDHCTESFTTRTGLATHCSSHLHVYMEQQAKQEAEDNNNNQKRTRMVFPCKWNNCPEVFTSLKALAKHLSAEDHVGQSPFLTKVETQQQIEYQYRTMPESKKKYQCTFPGCGKSFTDSSNRKKHERTHDANRERFYCTEPGCNRSYSTRTDLNIHIKVHKGEYPHKCTDPNCNKAFVRLSELYAHEVTPNNINADCYKRTHDNILPHVCSVCGKSFREKSRLKRHEDLHAKQSSPRNQNVNNVPSQPAALQMVAAQIGQPNPPNPHTNA